jgi:hypothetical protein
MNRTKYRGIQTFSRFSAETGPKSDELTPELTPVERCRPPTERFLRYSLVVLLMIGGKCSRLRAKPAHLVGHLPGVKEREGRAGAEEER